MSGPGGTDWLTIVIGVLASAFLTLLLNGLRKIRKVNIFALVEGFGFLLIAYGTSVFSIPYYYSGTTVVYSNALSYPLLTVSLGALVIGIVRLNEGLRPARRSRSES